jgi:hypothetical protein
MLMNPTILLCLAVVSAGFVYLDAHRQQIDHPFLWAGAVFLFWIAALPAYIWRRTKLQQTARSAPPAPSPN